MSAAPPTADPRLDYTGQTPTTINADYADMPARATISLVDKTSGAAQGIGMLLPSGGAGDLAYGIQPGTPSGAYVLVAKDENGKQIAESVTFYITVDG